MARSCCATSRPSSTSGCSAWRAIEDFTALEAIGDLAWDVYDKPDAGLWELRTRQSVHTYSSAMCWAACDRLANAAHKLGLEDRAAFWQDRADQMHAVIVDKAWRMDTQRLSATFRPATISTPA